MSQAPLNIAITAGTLTGNRGAEAMVTTCINRILEVYPSARVHVLTYYPTADGNESRDGRVLVHSSTPKQLVLNWFPLSILAFVFRFLKRKPKQDGEGILGLLGVDAVLDVAGVSFIDGREKFLPFNILTLLPFLLHGVPVYKISQALGPIRSLPNRVSSRLILPRLKLIVARGAQTYRHLEEFGLKPPLISRAPDVSFELKPRTKVDYVDREKLIYFGPSSLVESQAESYVENLAAVAVDLQKQGYLVKTLAHSWRDQEDAPRNNDVVVCRRLARKIEDLGGTQVEVVGPGLSALELKEAVGKSKLFVTSRFHGMIAALTTETPVVVVGWSHKYQEVLDSFGLADCGIKFGDMSVPALASLCDKTLNSGADISQTIATRLPEVTAESRRITDAILNDIVQKGHKTAVVDSSSTYAPSGG